jgi:hypothetical protein
LGIYDPLVYPAGNLYDIAESVWNIWLSVSTSSCTWQSDRVSHVVLQQDIDEFN